MTKDKIGAGLEVAKDTIVSGFEQTKEKVASGLASGIEKMRDKLGDDKGKSATKTINDSSTPEDEAPVVEEYENLHLHTNFDQ